ncbi:MAG: Rnase Y domain-containing protein [Oligoflexia bacterium]|nr:Rnase Y domain-containing protein [Oligoflexia bacterium]
MYGQWIIPIIVALSLAAGAALGQFWRIRWLRMRLRREVHRILDDAKRRGQAEIADAQLQAQRLFLDKSQEVQSGFDDLREQLGAREAQLNERAVQLEKVEAAQQERITALAARERALLSREQESERLRRQLESDLARISRMDPEEAQRQALEQARLVIGPEVDRYREQLLRDASETVDRRVRSMLATALERCVRDGVASATSVLLPLSDPEMKGRVIGRDGRNIRAFEAITGVDVLLDEVPGSVMLASHNPERREIARQALQQLIGDGRIQPSRIEQVVSETKASLQEQCLEWGRQVAQQAHCGDLHADVLRILGQLKLRASYGQNVLAHLAECASFAALVGAELGLAAADRVKLVRAALLHDIGKALPDSSGEPHALAGARFLAKYGEDAQVVNAVAAHHTEVADESFLAPLVRAVDAMSAGRPGARREDVQATLKRMDQMEELAKREPGVREAFVLQAGRELHVVVDSSVLSDQEAQSLVQRLVQSIERAINFSGRVRVSVIREVKIEAIATWQAR